MSSITFGYLILYVDDVLGTLQAWETALGLKRRYVHEDGNYAEFGTGDTVISLAETGFGRDHFTDDATRAMFDRKPSRFEVGFTVQDVQVAFDHAVANGMTPVVAPVTKPWGQVVGWVSDANGILIEFGSTMEE
jgi:lactoylglutathione lyase